MEEITVDCTECHKPVLSQEAMAVDFIDENGTPYVAVFHHPRHGYGCAAEWVAKRLDNVDARLADTMRRLKEKWNG